MPDREVSFEDYVSIALDDECDCGLQAQLEQHVLVLFAGTRLAVNVNTDTTCRVASLIRTR